MTSAVDTTRAAELVALCTAQPDLVEGLDPEVDLHDAGMNSGELVLVAMRVEDEIGRALSDDEMSTASTLHAIEALLRDDDA